MREYRRAWRLSTARRRRSTGPALHDREASDGYAATAGDSSSARSAAPLGDLDLISRQRSKQRGIKVTVLRAGAQKMSANPFEPLYRGSDAVALGLADATGHALDAFDSFARAINARN